MVIHVIRDSRAACVVTEVMAGHRPSIWTSNLHGPRQRHADFWQGGVAQPLPWAVVLARDAVIQPGG